MMVVAHLPQYLANLTQHIGPREAIVLRCFFSCTRDIVYYRCGVWEHFCTFSMSVFKTFSK